MSRVNYLHVYWRIIVIYTSCSALTTIVQRSLSMQFQIAFEFKLYLCVAQSTGIHFHFFLKKDSTLKWFVAL